MDKITKENNKLKLDNAALRAENQVLKHQLNYFENLFAKKTQSMNASTSVGSTISGHYGNSASMSDHHSHRSNGRMNKSDSVFSGEDHIERRLQQPRVMKTPNQSNILGFENSSQNQDEGEISFVLERNVAASPTGGKVGLFSLALIMCICCCSSFFSNNPVALINGNQFDGQPTQGGYYEPNANQ